MAKITSELTGKNVRIFVTDECGDEFEIKDLYWFEENYVHDFSGDAHYDQYKYRIEIS